MRNALVAEDDADMRELVRGYLAGMGFCVHAISTVDTSVALAVADELSLAIVDVRAPGSRGLALFKLLRRRRATLPILVTTSFSDVGFQSNVVAFGRAALLEKPYDFDDLACALRHVSLRSWPQVDRELRSRAR